jgi:polyphosphate glucokinase
MVILGLDFGGSGIKGGLVDIEKGELTQPRIRIPTPEGAKPKDVASVVAEICRGFGYQGPAGGTIPGVVQHGVVMTAANIDDGWVGKNAERLFAQASGCDFFVVNDADAAGLAEMRYGVGREFRGQVVLMITLGTGIGSALFVDGRLVPNLELGHLKVREKDAEKRASDAARQKKELTWPAYAEVLDEVLGEIEALIWPDVIVIGGGISKEGEKFIPLLKRRAKVVPAQLLNQAGIIGAALYASEMEKTGRL